MIYIKAVLILIEIISSILLVVIVLLQRSKNEGLGLAFGSQMGESLFGARAGNVLVKATVWLGIIFMVNTTVLAKIYSQGTSRSLISESSAPAPMQQQAPAQAGAGNPAPVGQPMNQSAVPSAPLSAPVTPMAPDAVSPVVPVSVPSATPDAVP
ncbi:MAG: preprotein translocase subunit SecG [Kiritimatiellae bacterium]|nr:preprotein translocase subunit SecG [Kiritimatiellia bacterium]